MITKIARFVMILAFALGVLGVSTSPALADKPDRGEYTFSQNVEVTDMCPFTFWVDSIYDWSYINFLDQSGEVIKYNWHFVAQDTFTSEYGTVLVGLPYTFNWIGTTNKAHFSGIAEKIRLPDGSLFISAGWTDLLTFDGDFGLSTDRGKQGDMDAFCAALE